MTTESTKTDSAANEWAITDRIIHLREWGTEVIHALPQPSTNGPTNLSIGSAETCSIQLHDPSGHISRLHASLVQHRASEWLLHDLSSKNGTRIDGIRCTTIELKPSDEIGIGNLTLIAESHRLVELRTFLARLLGWRGECIPVVDHALRSIRMAATRRTTLVLCGDGDLVPIARAIHRRVFGADRPFIVCDPRRRQGEATVRSPQNYETGMPAFKAATGGSLCVRHLRLPQDFDSAMTALRTPSSQVRLMLCVQASEERGEDLAVPITIPPLSTRPDELDRIITEYAEDALTELGLPHAGFLPADRDWVRTHSASSLPEIEKATLRLVAIRDSRNVSAAAARLGMAPVSLSRWIGRRKLPMHIEPSCEHADSPPFE
jgi:FHA domain